MSTNSLHYLAEHDVRRSESVPEGLAYLPEHTARHIMNAQAGLDEGSLIAGSVHLMYAVDSAVLNLGYMHQVTEALRVLRQAVVDALYARVDRSREVLVARERCRRVVFGALPA